MEYLILIYSVQYENSMRSKEYNRNSPAEIYGHAIFNNNCNDQQKQSKTKKSKNKDNSKNKMPTYVFIFILKPNLW